MVNPNDIVDRLASAAGRRVGNSSDGRYVQLPRACCGVYDAQSDGLKVTAFASGKLGVWCHQAPMSGLENFRHCAAGIRAYWGVEIDTYEQGQQVRSGSSVRGIPSGATPIGGVRRWDYQAADGQTVYACRQDYRRVSGKLDKMIWREPRGVHAAGIHVRLYGDDGQSPVVLCEGEKAADAVAAAGYVAASYCGGSKSAAKANYAGLLGRDVIIWPDDDQEGMRAAADSGQALIGIASSIRIVQVHDRDDGSDAADCSPDDIGIRIAGAGEWEPPEPPDLTDPRYDTPLLYIERDELGLGLVLAGLKLEMRLNSRTLTAEIQRVDYETSEGKAWYQAYGIDPMPPDGWVRMNDHLRDSLRTAIARRARFIPDGRVARYTDWQLVENAYVATRRVDPVRQWLDSLPIWDGVPRVGSMFIDVLGADDTPLHRATATAFMVGAVNRTMTPGCQHDWVPVLIGAQGGGKSTFAKSLVPAQNRRTWFSDQTDFSETPQKQVEGVGTALIVEFAELKGLSYAKIETAKTYLSRETDHIRLSYRRNSDDLPRHWVGIATANPATGGVLPADETGNRRFVSIPVSPPGPAAVTAYMDQHRDQLWAEALALWRRGEKSYLADEYKSAQADANAGYEQGNEGLANKVAGYVITDTTRLAGVEILHLMSTLQIIDAERRDQTALNPYQQRLVAQELQRQGWVKRIKWVGEGKAKKRKNLWFPPDDPAAADEKIPSPEAPASAWPTTTGGRWIGNGETRACMTCGLAFYVLQDGNCLGCDDKKER